MMDIKDILKFQRQSLSLMIAPFNICESCNIVDAEWERCNKGFLCPNCGEPSEIGRTYLPTSVRATINLMQSHYHINSHESMNTDHRLAIVIFYATLGEVLFSHFLRMALVSKGYSTLKIEEEFNNYIYFNQKRRHLFPKLIGVAFETAVKEISKKNSFDYIQVVRFYITVNQKRNIFVHEGQKWCISEEMPEKCMINIQPLVNLFIDLHNKYLVNG